MIRHSRLILLNSSRFLVSISLVLKFSDACSSSVKINFKIMCPISMQFATMPADMRFIKSLAELNISGNKWVTTLRGRLVSDEHLFHDC